MQAHCHYVVLRSFVAAIEKALLCPANLSIIKALCSLYAVFGLVQYFGEFSLVSNSSILSNSELLYVHVILGWVHVNQPAGHDTPAPLSAVDSR